jgi:antitoxin HigA-1
MLVEEFLKPMAISAHKLALDLHVPASRTDEIIKGKRGITAYTALRLSRYFGNSAQFWMNLQTNYDLEIAKRKSWGISRETPPCRLLNRD